MRSFSRLASDSSRLIASSCSRRSSAWLAGPRQELLAIASQMIAHGLNGGGVKPNMSAALIALRDRLYLFETIVAEALAPTKDRELEAAE